MKEHRRKQGLCFQQVDFVAGWIREEQPDQCIAEDGSDFVNGAVEGGVAIAHERCPWRIHKSCGDWSLIQPSTMSAPPVGFEIDW